MPNLLTKAEALTRWMIDLGKLKVADPSVASHPATPLAAFALPWLEEALGEFFKRAEAEPAVAFGVHAVEHIAAWLEDDGDARDVEHAFSDAVAVALGSTAAHAGAPPAVPAPEPARDVASSEPPGSDPAP